MSGLVLACGQMSKTVEHSDKCLAGFGVWTNVWLGMACGQMSVVTG